MATRTTTTVQHDTRDDWEDVTEVDEFAAITCEELAALPADLRRIYAEQPRAFAALMALEVEQ